MFKFSALVVALLAMQAAAFTSTQSPRLAATSLNAGFLEGVKQDPSTNAYAIGGKNSWEFEMDAMYVEEPPVKKAPAKKAPAKKVVAKKAAPAKKVVAKKAAPAKKVAAKKAAPAAKKAGFSFFK